MGKAKLQSIPLAYFLLLRIMALEELWVNTLFNWLHTKYVCLILQHTSSTKKLVTIRISVCTELRYSICFLSVQLIFPDVLSELDTWTEDDYTFKFELIISATIHANTEGKPNSRFPGIDGNSARVLTFLSSKSWACDNRRRSLNNSFLSSMVRLLDGRVLMQYACRRKAPLYRRCLFQVTQSGDRKLLLTIEFGKLSLSHMTLNLVTMLRSCDCKIQSWESTLFLQMSNCLCRNRTCKRRK